MLTRLKVNGFKNLLDVDLRFGPFTCIAGPNGVGKSNVFDAIQLLSALADLPLLEAAAGVRGEGMPSPRPEQLFHCSGGSRVREMLLEAEMLIPPTGEDDLGQPAEAAITFLRYRLLLILTERGISIREEVLDYVKKGQARDALLFPHRPKWRNSVATGRRTSPFISTRTGDQGTEVLLHQDQGSAYKGGGRPRPHIADRLTRTVLSSASSADSATALLARREMRSWRLLQLEPSAMRAPDSFRSSKRMGTDGAHLPAALDRIAGTDGDRGRLLARIASRVNELVGDVRAVGVDRDERRETMTLVLTLSDGSEHEARALSDGTLRFLALAALEEDHESTGVICLEEPENGIHPLRTESMVTLLGDIAVDPDEPVGLDNPLRQVIVNTHSPAVIAQVPDGDLVVARLLKRRFAADVALRPVFHCLQGTWRDAKQGMPQLPRGDLLALLQPVPARSEAGFSRVVDREDVQPLLPFPAS